ncbi:MAG: amidase family protein [Phormidesmis sp.]
MASPETASSNVFEIEEASVAALQAAMSSGELRATRLVDYYLMRIEQLDDRLKAMISLNPRAREIATALDQERASGQQRSTLHGIPLVIKDNIDTAELPTTGGAKALAKLQPPDDAFAVAQLRAAGAIILGKTNLHELAYSGETLSSLGGQTRNPYNLDYTPGGSSGGSAVAIAANFATVGLGTDTINSVRSPASACNIVGLRPTAGLVSRDGIIPVALSQDTIGPMGRTVADVATVLEVIAVDDPADPMTARSTRRRKGSYQPFLKKSGLSGKRLGIVRSLFGQTVQHQPVNGLMDTAFSAMEGLGAHCLEISVKIDIDQLLDELSVLQWEGKLHLNKYLETLGAAAPVKSLKALLKSGQVHSSIQPLLKKLQAVDSPLGSGEYWQRCYPRRAELRQVLTRIFRSYHLDALVYPHQRKSMALIGETQQERNGFLAAASGFPAITIPAGFAPQNLPVGIEFMAMPFQEAQLLQMAYAYEQKTNWRRLPQLAIPSKAPKPVKLSR